MLGCNDHSHCRGHEALPATDRQPPGQGSAKTAGARRLGGSLLLAVLVAAPACLTDPSDDGATPDAGAGGAGGAGDAGGAGGADTGATGCPAGTGDGPAMPTTPACTMPAKWRGALAKPTPLVSIGRPVTTNSTDQASRSLIVDGKYHVQNGLLLTPVAGTPTWASIDVGAGYTQLLLGWQDVGYQDYGPSFYAATDYQTATSPAGYLIKTSADSTDGNDGTWMTVVTVADNPVRARTHLLPFAGMRWVRFEVTAAGQSSSGGLRDVRIDEIELRDYSAIADGDLTDGWFILGDSITKMSFNRTSGANELDRLIAAKRPGYAPALVEAGNGGETLKHVLRHLQNEAWLAYAEGLTFVTVAFGTNDSWGSNTPEAAGFETTMRSVIKLLIDAKRVPVLPRIPWNTVGAYVEQFNAVIDKLQQEYELPCGPDLYGVAAAHPEYVQGVATVQSDCTVTHSGDGVHPQSSQARAAINLAYADAVLPVYPPL
jgi:acyl-CoA thioesterase I